MTRRRASGLAIAAHPFQADDLIGSWSTSGNCDGDYGIVFERDGTFAVSDAMGRWIVRGDKLVTWFTEIVVGDDMLQEVKSARQVTRSIVTASKDDLALRYADGTEERLIRCP